MPQVVFLSLEELILLAVRNPQLIGFLLQNSWISITNYKIAVRAMVI